ncbi:MAG TPA: ATP-binding protein [Candidatus Saccharimonadales bacterium]
MLELIILLLSVLANVALATIVLVKNAQRVVNRQFAILALSIALWETVNYISLHPFGFDQLIWVRLTLATAAIMSLALVLLANVFPDGKPRFKSLAKFIVPVGIGVSLIALSPWLFTRLDYVDGGAQPVPGPAMALFMPFVIGTLVTSIAALVAKYRHLKGVAKRHVYHALIGITLTFSLLITFNFLVVVAFHSTAFLLLSPLIILIFTISFFYGIARYRLFDIRLIIARFVAYLMLLTFAGTLYGLVAVALSFVISGVTPNFTQIAVSTLVVGIFILFVQPLRRFFNHITGVLFHQDTYETKDVLDRMTSVLVRSTDTDEVAHSSMAILQDALKSDYITMFLLGGNDKTTARHISVGKSVSTVQLTADLLATMPDIIVADVLDGQSARLHQKMQHANVAVIARLETFGEVVGYCFFGYKTSGSEYTQRDIDLIRITSDELAVAVQNAIRFDQIQYFNENLQQRIDEATKELRASNEELQKLDEAKDEFVSMASHQLRTPLTSVKGYISMVLEGDAGKISDAQHHLLSEAFISSERMVHLINDFLNVSRLQTGKFMIDRRQVDLAHITEQEVSSLMTTAKAHDLKLRYKKPTRFPLLYIDEGKIRQVIMNFIDNAIYYSSDRSTITIGLEVLDNNVVLTVHNEGMGVPKEEQSHLFTKFFRATNARKQRPDGTGVGLFLAKRVITEHGGSMVFESELNKGATFGFRLPVKKLSTAPPPDPID